jgi:hypothetical protein
MTLQKNGPAAKRFAKVMKFGAWLMNIPNRLTPPPFRLMQISSAFWQSRALYVAAKLDIATILGDECLQAGDLAARVSANEDAVERLLRMLAAMGVFEEAKRGFFRNNKVSNFLRTDYPRNVRAMILMHNSDTMSRPWFEHLENGIRMGTPPFRLTHGEELFDYMDHNTHFDKLFSEAMDCVEALTGDSFATDFDWGRFDRIIDLGGSRGTKSLAILKRHLHLNALVVDRPQVIDEAKRFWVGQSVPGLERLRFEAGDLVTAIPQAASAKDIYFLSAILHGFDDDTSLKVLRNLAQAIGHSGARAAVMEMVLPETGTDIAGTSFDMQMFVCCRGRERTLNEWSALVREGGLMIEEQVLMQSLGSILVLRKA